jgi:hypothetical protein
MYQLCITFRSINEELNLKFNISSWDGKKLVECCKGFPFDCRELADILEEMAKVVRIADV